MSLHVQTLQEKIDAVEAIIVGIRRGSIRIENGPAIADVLKAVAADLRARQELPRGNTLGEMSRAVAAVKASKTAIGYEAAKVNAVATVVLNKWPVVRQALENYGEESAE